MARLIETATDPLHTVEVDVVTMDLIENATETAALVRRACARPLRRLLTEWNASPMGRGHCISQRRKRGLRACCEPSHAMHGRSRLALTCSQATGNRRRHSWSTIVGPMPERGCSR